MSMMMRDPSDMFMPLRQAMDRLLEGSFLWPGRLDLFTGQSFSIDLSESNDHQQYIVEATLHGFKPEEIQITTQGAQLTIHAASRGPHLSHWRVTPRCAASVAVAMSCSNASVNSCRSCSFDMLASSVCILADFMDPGYLGIRRATIKAHPATLHRPRPYGMVVSSVLMRLTHPISLPLPFSHSLEAHLAWLA